MNIIKDMLDDRKGLLARLENRMKEDGHEDCLIEENEDVKKIKAEIRVLDVTYKAMVYGVNNDALKILKVFTEPEEPYGISISEEHRVAAGMLIDEYSRRI